MYRNDCWLTWYSNSFQNASMPNKWWSSNFGQVAAQFSLFYPTLTQTNGPIFTIFLCNAEQLVELLMHASAKWWLIHFRTPQQTVKAVIWRLQNFPKLICYHSNVPWTTVKLMSRCNPHTYLYQQWNVGEDRSSSCWDIPWDRPIFSLSFKKVHLVTLIISGAGFDLSKKQWGGRSRPPVSYTHLTLPTIYSV